MISHHKSKLDHIKSKQTQIMQIK